MRRAGAPLAPRLPCWRAVGHRLRVPAPALVVEGGGGNAKRLWPGHLYTPLAGHMNDLIDTHKSQLAEE